MTEAGEYFPVVGLSVTPASLRSLFKVMPYSSTIRVIRYGLPAAALGFLVGASACSGPFEVEDSLGDWGGVGAVAHVEIGAASFEFDCAHASVPGGLTFDEDGAFSGSAIWVSEAGPQPMEPREELEAVVRGRISGSFMDLEVDIVPRDVTAGPYRLRRDRQPELRKCL